MTKQGETMFSVIKDLDTKRIKVRGRSRLRNNLDFVTHFRLDRNYNNTDLLDYHLRTWKEVWKLFTIYIGYSKSSLLRPNRLWECMVFAADKKEFEWEIWL